MVLTLENGQRLLDGSSFFNLRDSIGKALQASASGISGTLIESEVSGGEETSSSSTSSTTWLLIGIGINVAAAPRPGCDAAHDSLAYAKLTL